MSGSGYRGRGLGPRGIRPYGPAGGTGGPRFPHPNLNQLRRPNRFPKPDHWLEHPIRPPFPPPWQLNGPTPFPNFPQRPLYRYNVPFNYGGRGRGNNVQGIAGRGRGPPCGVPGPRFPEPCGAGAIRPMGLQVRYESLKNEPEFPQEPLLGSEEERQQKISETADKLKQKLSTIPEKEINFWDDDLIIGESSCTLEEELAISNKGIPELQHDPPELNLTFNDFKDIGRVDLDNATVLDNPIVLDESQSEIVDTDVSLLNQENQNTEDVLVFENVDDNMFALDVTSEIEVPCPQEDLQEQQADFYMADVDTPVDDSAVQPQENVIQAETDTCLSPLNFQQEDPSILDNTSETAVQIDNDNDGNQSTSHNDQFEPEFRYNDQSFEKKLDLQSEMSPNFQPIVRPELQPRFACRPEFRPRTFNAEPRFPPRMMGPRFRWPFPHQNMGPPPRRFLGMPGQGNRLPPPRFMPPPNGIEMGPVIFNPHTPPPRRRVPFIPDDHCVLPPPHSNDLTPGFNVKDPNFSMADHPPGTDPSPTLEPPPAFDPRKPIGISPSQNCEEILQPPPAFDPRGPRPSIGLPSTNNYMSNEEQQKKLYDFGSHQPPSNLLNQEETLQPPHGSFDPWLNAQNGSTMVRPPPYDARGPNAMAMIVMEPPPITDFNLTSNVSQVPTLPMVQSSDPTSERQIIFPSTFCYSSTPQVMQREFPLPQMNMKSVQPAPPSVPAAAATTVSQIQPPLPKERPPEASVSLFEQPVASNMEEDLVEMQEALAFAKQFMNMSEEENNVSTMPDLPPIPSSSPTKDILHVPLPPSAPTHFSSDKPKTKEHKPKKTKQKIRGGMQSISEKFREKNQNMLMEEFNQSFNNEGDIPLPEEQTRPKVIFNVYSNVKKINKPEEWEQRNEEATSKQKKIQACTPSVPVIMDRKLEQHEDPVHTTVNEQHGTGKLHVNGHDDRKRKKDTGKSTHESRDKGRGKDHKHLIEKTQSCPSEKIHSLSQNGHPLEKSQSPYSSPKDVDCRLTKDSDDGKSTSSVSLGKKLSKKVKSSNAENSWKDRIIKRFLKMSKNDICNMVNNSSLRKFDIAMQHLVKERKSSASREMRSATDDKVKGYDREEFIIQLNAMLDPSATVDITNLPTEFIHHLSEVLQLDPLPSDVNDSILDAETNASSNAADTSDALELDSFRVNDEHSSISCNTENCTDPNVGVNYSCSESKLVQDPVIEPESRNVLELPSTSTKDCHLDNTIDPSNSLVDIQNVKKCVETSDRDKLLDKEETSANIKYEEQTTLLKMADLDDIFSAGIARAKLIGSSSKPSQLIETEQETVEVNEVLSTEADRFDQHVDINEPTTVDLDSIFSVGIAKAKLASLKSTESEPSDKKKVRDHKSPTKDSYSSQLEKLNKRWNRKEREDPDMFRNLTKEEWEAKYGRSMNSEVKRELKESSKDISLDTDNPNTNVTNTPPMKLKTNYQKTRYLSTSPKHYNTSSLSIDFLDNDVEKFQEQSKDEKKVTSSDSDTSSYSNVSSSDSNSETASDVTKLLKVIKEREKIAKEKSLSETIRDEVTAEIERKWKEKEKYKERRARKRDKKRREKKEKRKRERKRKRKRSHHTGDSSSEKESDTLRLLTENEIKKEVVIKREPGLEEEQSTSIGGVINLTLTSPYERKKAASGNQNINVAVTTDLDRTKPVDKTSPGLKLQHPKTKAQLKQMPELSVGVMKKDIIENRVVPMSSNVTKENEDTAKRVIHLSTKENETMPKLENTSQKREPSVPSVLNEGTPATVLEARHLRDTITEKIPKDSTSHTCTNIQVVNTDVSRSTNALPSDTLKEADATLNLLGSTSTKHTVKKIDIEAYKARTLQRKEKQQEAFKELRKNPDSLTYDLLNIPLTSKHRMENKTVEVVKDIQQTNPERIGSDKLRDPRLMKQNKTQITLSSPKEINEVNQDSSKWQEASSSKKDLTVDHVKGKQTKVKDKTIDSTEKHQFQKIHLKQEIEDGEMLTKHRDKYAERLVAPASKKIMEGLVERKDLRSHEAGQSEKLHSSVKAEKNHSKKRLSKDREETTFFNKSEKEPKENVKERSESSSDQNQQGIIQSTSLQKVDSSVRINEDCLNNKMQNETINDERKKRKAHKKRDLFDELQRKAAESNEKFIRKSEESKYSHGTVKGKNTVPVEKEIRPISRETTVAETRSELLLETNDIKKEAKVDQLKLQPMSGTSEETFTPSIADEEFNKFKNIRSEGSKELKLIKEKTRKRTREMLKKDTKPGMPTKSSTKHGTWKHSTMLVAETESPMQEMQVTTKENLKRIAKDSSKCVKAAGHVKSLSKDRDAVSGDNKQLEIPANDLDDTKTNVRVLSGINRTPSNEPSCSGRSKQPIEEYETRTSKVEDTIKDMANNEIQNDNEMQEGTSDCTENKDRLISDGLPDTVPEEDINKFDVKITSSVTDEIVDEPLDGLCSTEITVPFVEDDAKFPAAIFPVDRTFSNDEVPMFDEHSVIDSEEVILKIETTCEELEIDRHGSITGEFLNEEANITGINVPSSPIGSGSKEDRFLNEQAGSDTDALDMNLQVQSDVDESMLSSSKRFSTSSECKEMQETIHISDIYSPESSDSLFKGFSDDLQSDLLGKHELLSFELEEISDIRSNERWDAETDIHESEPEIKAVDVAFDEDMILKDVSTISLMIPQKCAGTTVACAEDVEEQDDVSFVNNQSTSNRNNNVDETSSNNEMEIFGNDKVDEVSEETSEHISLQKATAESEVKDDINMELANLEFCLGDDDDDDDDDDGNDDDDNEQRETELEKEENVDTKNIAVPLIKEEYIVVDQSSNVALESKGSMKEIKSVASGETDITNDLTEDEYSKKVNTPLCDTYSLDNSLDFENGEFIILSEISCEEDERHEIEGEIRVELMSTEAPRPMEKETFVDSVQCHQQFTERSTTSFDFNLLDIPKEKTLTTSESREALCLSPGIGSEPDTIVDMKIDVLDTLSKPVTSGAPTMTNCPIPTKAALKESSESLNVQKELCLDFDGNLDEGTRETDLRDGQNVEQSVSRNSAGHSRDERIGEALMDEESNMDDPSTSFERFELHMTDQLMEEGKSTVSNDLSLRLENIEESESIVTALEKNETLSDSPRNYIEMKDDSSAVRRVSSEEVTAQLSIVQAGTDNINIIESSKTSGDAVKQRVPYVELENMSKSNDSSTKKMDRAVSHKSEREESKFKKSHRLHRIKRKHETKHKKSKYKLSEKLIKEVVKAEQIVKVVRKPGTKEAVMARMLEIDVEIHKLMSEKMALYRMLESGSLPTEESPMSSNDSVEYSATKNEDAARTRSPSTLMSRLIRNMEVCPTVSGQSTVTAKTNVSSASSNVSERKTEYLRSPERKSPPRSENLILKHDSYSSDDEDDVESKRAPPPKRRKKEKSEKTMKRTDVIDSEKYSNSRIVMTDKSVKSIAKGKTTNEVTVVHDQLSMDDRKIDTCDEKRERLACGANETLKIDEVVKESCTTSKMELNDESNRESKEKSRNKSNEKTEIAFGKPESNNKDISYRKRIKSSKSIDRTGRKIGSIKRTKEEERVLDEEHEGFTCKKTPDGLESKKQERVPIYSDESTWESFDSESREPKKVTTGLALLEETFKREKNVLKSLERKRKRLKELPSTANALTPTEEEMPLNKLYIRKLQQKRNLLDSLSRKPRAKKRTVGNSLDESSEMSKNLIAVINAVAENKIEELYAESTGLRVPDDIINPVEASTENIVTVTVETSISTPNADDKVDDSVDFEKLSEKIDLVVPVSSLDDKADLTISDISRVDTKDEPDLANVCSESTIIDQRETCSDPKNDITIMSSNNDEEEIQDSPCSRNELDAYQSQPDDSKELCNVDVIADATSCTDVDKSKDDARSASLEKETRQDGNDEVPIDSCMFEIIDELQEDEVDKKNDEENCQSNEESKEEAKVENVIEKDDKEEIVREEEREPIDRSPFEETLDQNSSQEYIIQDEFSEDHNSCEPEKIVLVPVDNAISSTEQSVPVDRVDSEVIASERSTIQIDQNVTILKELEGLNSIIEKISSGSEKTTGNSARVIELDSSRRTSSLEDEQLDNEVMAAFSGDLNDTLKEKVACYEEHSTTPDHSVDPKRESEEELEEVDDKQGKKLVDESLTKTRPVTRASTSRSVSRSRSSSQPCDPEDKKLSGHRRKGHKVVAVRKRMKLPEDSARRTRRNGRNSNNSNSEKIVSQDTKEQSNRTSESPAVEAEDASSNAKRTRVKQKLRSTVLRKRSNLVESDTSSNEQRSIPAEGSSIGSSPAQSSKGSTLEARPEYGKRKLANQTQMMNCKVRLVDSKYTYLRPDLHPSVLQKIGISVINNPYVRTVETRAQSTMHSVKSDDVEVPSVREIDKIAADTNLVRNTKRMDSSIVEADEKTEDELKGTREHDVDEDAELENVKETHVVLDNLSSTEDEGGKACWKSITEAVRGASMKQGTSSSRNSTPCSLTGTKIRTVIEPRSTSDIEIVTETKVLQTTKGRDAKKVTQQTTATKDNEPIRTQYNVHKGPILDIKIFGDSFLAASEDGTIYRYSHTSNKILNIYRGHKSAVTCLYVLKTGSSDITRDWMFSGSLDGTLRCYNIMTGAQVRDTTDVGSPVQCMDQAWGMIFLGTKSGHVTRFHVKPFFQSGVVKGDKIKFSEESVLALKATNEGARRVLVVASRSQPITIRDAQNGLFLRTVSGHKSHTVYSLMMDNNLIYCGTSSTSILVFDFVSGKQITHYSAGVGIVCMRLYQKLLFAGCYDGNIYVFDIKDEKLVCNIPGPGNMLLSLEVVKNKIIAGSKDRRLHAWQMPWQVRTLLSDKT